MCPIQQNPKGLNRSSALKERAQRRIPSSTQTFSKGPTQFVQGVAPVFLETAAGCTVWDVDGNEYLDYAMGLGPVILGHAYEPVVEAVTNQVQHATALSLPHPLEVEVAEKLAAIIPSAEMARFGKNGSDATSGAVRAARAITRRDRIACCGYHGWQDWFIGTTTRRMGVPAAVAELTSPFSYNDIDGLKRILDNHPDEFAAVIMEPVGLQEPEGDFLHDVKELAHARGALLIFDEVVTGFRVALGGAQEHYGVTPDLACFGKAMGNGIPISAVVGNANVMRVFDEIFFSFTFGGDPLGLTAADVVISEMERHPVIAHIWQQGAALKEGTNQLIIERDLQRIISISGLPCRTVISFSDDQASDSLMFKSLFQQECIKRGVLFTGGHNLSYAHSPAVIEKTLDVYGEVLDLLSAAVASGDAASFLEGPPIQAVFRNP